MYFQIQKRWGSFGSSPQYTKPEDYTDYEITNDPNEWKCVENVLPYKIIPEAPTGNFDLPSGWKPAWGKTLYIYPFDLFSVLKIIYTRVQFFISKKKFLLTASPKDNSYFIERTKNHMQPVYLNISYRGIKKVTVIKNIQGNIWEMDRDIKQYLLDHEQWTVASQIHEFACLLKFRGDIVARIKRWMDTKGF